MSIQAVVLEKMEEVFGVEQEELKDNPDLDLIENGIMDSLGIVTLLDEIGNALDKDFDISNMQPGDFRTLNTITEAIESRI